MPLKRPDTIYELIQQRFSRRQLMGATVAGLVSACGAPGSGASAPRFATISGSKADAVVVPKGYRSDVLIRWGDALNADAHSLDARAVPDGVLLEAGAAARQASQFGFDCDGIAIFPRSVDRMVLAVNHEVANPALMFPNWGSTARSGNIKQWTIKNAEAVGVMQAAVGVSVFEIERHAEKWQFLPTSGLNRRVMATTPVEFSGPAADHEFLRSSGGADADPRGTIGNCASGATPWQTYLTAEENVHDFFANGGDADLTDAQQAVYARFGYRRGNSVFGWEFIDDRFDMSARPNELFRFGWITEINPLEPTLRPRKRTALGRFKHEGATSVLSADNRVVVYMGDDEVFEYFYKFVSHGKFDLHNPSTNDRLLDDGVLYVAQLHADGSGVWLPLVWSENGELSPRNGFRNQADVLINCRGAADVLGATPLDRPEDVAVNPLTHAVYLSCTQNLQRGSDSSSAAKRRGINSAPDAANPRKSNSGGHILEFIEANDDHAAHNFYWQPFVLAGEPTDETLKVHVSYPMEGSDVYFGGYDDADRLSGFANPDNLSFDDRGNLWVVTDGAQPSGNNNGCFVCPTAGPERGAVRQFMAGPVGAEICGCEITPDQRTIFLSVQHPGSGGTVDEPISHWPDGGDSAARPSVVVIEPVASNVKLGDI